MKMVISSRSQGNISPSEMQALSYLAAISSDPGEIKVDGEGIGATYGGEGLAFILEDVELGTRLLTQPVADYLGMRYKKNEQYVKEDLDFLKGYRLNFYHVATPEYIAGELKKTGIDVDVSGLENKRLEEFLTAKGNSEALKEKQRKVLMLAGLYFDTLKHQMKARVVSMAVKQKRQGTP